MNRNRGGIVGSVMFLFGLVFGGLLTLLLSTNEKGETRDMVKDKVEQLKTRLKEVAEKERVKEVFGDVTDAATASYREARELLIAKLATVKEAVKDIDKDKYKAVVKEVADELKKEGKMTAAQLKKISTFMVDDYKRVTRRNTQEEA